MKRLLVLFVGLAAMVGWVSAQSNTFEVAYYDGDPAGSGEVIITEETTANGVAQRNEDLEDAEYVTISHGDQSYTFEVETAGASRNSVVLDLPGRDLSVASLLTNEHTKRGALERNSN